MPSAIVLAPCGCAVPLTALTIAGKRAVCTPTMRMPGLSCARRGRDAADQPAAADGDDQRVEVGLRAQHLDAYRALAGDDQLVVERVDEGQALLVGELQRVLARLVEGVAVQHDLGAEAARALDLDHRRRQRHHDHRAQAQPLRVVRHTLRVVAGRRGDDALDRLPDVDQRRQLVQRAALLERRGELQVLELQEDLRADDLAQRLAIRRTACRAPGPAAALAAASMSAKATLKARPAAVKPFRRP